MTTPQTPPPPHVQGELVPHRPWLGPAIASAVLAVIVAILLIPNVLLYPDAQETSDVPNEALAESNEALQRRADELREMLDAGVCVQDGTYQFQDPARAQERGVTPQDLEDAVMPELREPQPVPRPRGPNGELAPHEPPTGPVENLPELLRRSVVLIVAGDSTGTGFFIEPDLVLTNGHVASGRVGSTVYVVSRALGVPMEATIESTTGDADIGTYDFSTLRLSESPPGIEVLEFTSAPEQLTRVVAAGFPGHVLQFDENFLAMMQGQQAEAPNMVMWPGDVTTIYERDIGPIIIHSAQTTPGNSGGPTVDRCGRVVGVNTFVSEESQGGGRTNHALSSQTVKNWMQSEDQDISLNTGVCVPESAFEVPAEEEPAEAAEPVEETTETDADPSESE